jgi:hypothetical protein
LREIQSELLNSGLKSGKKDGDSLSGCPPDTAPDGIVMGDVPWAEVQSVGE